MRHPDVIAAEHEKPDLPVWPTPLTDRPLVRFIAHPDIAVTAPWLDHWADQLVLWMGEGREPYFFMHCPNNAHSPSLARDFHARVLERAAGAGIRLPEMPPWPGEGERPGEQLSLM
jgi:uncharacterized protein YecE (DUF72 family)